MHYSSLVDLKHVIFGKMMSNSFFVVGDYRLADFHPTYHQINYTLVQR